jgi:hypothetical protein
MYFTAMPYLPVILNELPNPAFHIPVLPPFQPKTPAGEYPADRQQRH